MGKELQLFLKGLEGKTTIIRIDEDASIAQLRRMIHEKTLISLEEMRVLYCSKELRDTDENRKEQFLSDYRIQDEGNLVLVLRLRGGSDQQGQTNGTDTGTVEIVDSDTVETTEDLSPPLKVLGPDVELTSEPDMITFDDDKDGLRAKMPCGHAIGPESLTAYCRSLLTSGKYEFRCPHMDPSYCGRIWEFYTVNKLAVLTKQERKEFETQIAMNFLRKAVGIQECPRCQSYCERMDRKDVRVVCPVCSRKPGGRFEFCWFCLRKWSTSGTAECGNLDCSGEDPRKKILRECPEKKVVEVSCPSVRACPKCGLMIEHREACKQMECPCGQKFCFICLKMADARGQYTCGAWNFKCVKAPVQTQLP
ncbi:uncharacterized protein [Mytilus edulis]|uniref:uncharacterized protein n=1 Tax=Mytilus edulis TaxID=6550 RepID=UPI0039EE76F1